MNELRLVSVIAEVKPRTVWRCAVGFNEHEATSDIVSETSPIIKDVNRVLPVHQLISYPQYICDRAIT